MEPIEHCWDVTTKEARALADALDDAGFERNPHDKAYRLDYTLKGPDPSDPLDETRAAIYLSFGAGPPERRVDVLAVWVTARVRNRAVPAPRPCRDGGEHDTRRARGRRDVRLARWHLPCKP
jgi:hypothetical protein